eukprot:gene3120-8208_t
MAERSETKITPIEGHVLALPPHLASVKSPLDLLLQRARSSGDEKLFVFVDEKIVGVNTGLILRYVGDGKKWSVTSTQLVAGARGIASALQSASVGASDTVLIIIPTSIVLVSSFYACLLLGAVPVVLPSASSKPEEDNLTTIWTKVAAEMKSNVVLVAAKQRYRVPAETWQSMNLTAVAADTKHNKVYTGTVVVRDRKQLAFIEYTSSSSGLLTGVGFSHVNMLALAQACKNHLKLHKQERIVLQIDPCHGLGLAGWMYLHV